MSKDSERKEVYTVIDKGGEEKGWWVRVGTAFVNRDGSLNVKLDALPVNGTLHIRDPLPKQDESGRPNGSRGGERDRDTGRQDRDTRSPSGRR